MRVAYAVHGYGRGHATRVLALLPEIARRHEVRLRCIEHARISSDELRAFLAGADRHRDALRREPLSGNGQALGALEELMGELANVRAGPSAAGSDVGRDRLVTILARARRKSR